MNEAIKLLQTSIMVLIAIKANLELILHILNLMNG